MFFAPDRIPHMRAMNPCRQREKTRRVALKKLLPMQRLTLSGCLKRWTGCRVKRFVCSDPPLHEFFCLSAKTHGRYLASLTSAKAKQKKTLVEEYRDMARRGLGT